MKDYNDNEMFYKRFLFKKFHRRRDLNRHVTGQDKRVLDTASSGPTSWLNNHKLLEH